MNRVVDEERGKEWVGFGCSVSLKVIANGLRNGLDPNTAADQIEEIIGLLIGDDDKQEE